jgi:hypothetical protein
MRQLPPQRDTEAWVFQAWSAFSIAFGGMAIGIVFLPLDAWTRGFLGMGLVFTVSACFTLGKTVRDNHEATKLINRISDAKAEKLLTEYEGAPPLA